MFAISQRAHRIRFGVPFETVLDDELSRLGVERYFLICGPRGAERFRDGVEGRVSAVCAGAFSDSVAHVPQAVARRAAEALAASGADGVVAFGGGAAFDTAKAASRESGTPILAIPTTFSGSEVTSTHGLTVDGVKRSVADPSMLPKTVIYDPRLAETLSQAVATCSGVNAIAHAVEALYAADANPMTAAIAEAGVRKLVAGLEQRSQPVRGDADADCFAGSWLCGEALAQVGMALHHRIAHVLGGTYGLPHAEAHTVVLPYAIAFNRSHAPGLAALDGLFPGRSLAAGLAEFAGRLGAPRSLRELGFRQADIAEAARLALVAPLQNPRPASEADIAGIIGQAFAGAELA